MMKHCLILFFAIVFTNSISAQNSTFADSLKQIVDSHYDAPEKITYFKENPAKVRIISTCSVDPGMCGYFIFSSVVFVEVLNGNYIGDSIAIICPCQLVNYKKGETYTLHTISGPRSGLLCSGKIDHGYWTIDLKRKYLAVQGYLGGQWNLNN